MRELFVDTWFWVARFNKHDQHHQAALSAQKRLGSARLITTDEVLVEVLTSLSGFGSSVRRSTALAVRRLIDGEGVEVVPQTRESFLAGLKLYEARLDKAYSLTDCISMETMRQRGLNEILTNDHHFSQEGFTLVPRRTP